MKDAIAVAVHTAPNQKRSVLRAVVVDIIGKSSGRQQFKPLSRELLASTGGSTLPHSAAGVTGGSSGGAADYPSESVPDDRVPDFDELNRRFAALKGKD